MSTRFRRREKGRCRPYPAFLGTPKFTQAFFTKTTKELRSSFYKLQQYGIKLLILQKNYMEIYLDSKEAFYAVVQDLPNVTTEKFESSNIRYHKCQPTSSILIIFEEEENN